MMRWRCSPLAAGQFPSMVDRVLGVVRIDCTIFLAGFVNRNLVLRLEIHDDVCGMMACSNSRARL